MKVVEELDINIWNEFIEQNPGSNIFHTPEMSDVFRNTKGYHPIFIASVDAKGRPLAICSPTMITLMNGALRQFTSRAVGFGSVLIEPSELGLEALSKVLEMYNRKVKNKVLFTELRNLADLTQAQPILSRHGMIFEGHLNFLIDLNQSEKTLQANIKSNARRNIRKAEKSGVQIVQVTDEEGVSTAFGVLQHVYRRLEVPLPDRSLFHSAFEILDGRDHFRIFLAKLDGAAIGAMSLLIHKGVVTYWYSGTLKDYFRYRPNDLLVWHAIKWGRQMGCHTFDFGGGGKPDEEYGVRDFKAKFGGQLVNFGRNVNIHHPLRFQVSKTGYAILRKFI